MFAFRRSSAFDLEKSQTETVSMVHATTLTVWPRTALLLLYPIRTAIYPYAHILAHSPSLSLLSDAVHILKYSVSLCLPPGR